MSGCPCFSLHFSICLKGIVNSCIQSLIFYQFLSPLQPSALSPSQRQTVVWHPQRLLLKMTCWFAAMGTPEQRQHLPLAHQRAQATVPNATPLASKSLPSSYFRSLAGTLEGCALNNKSAAASPASSSSHCWIIRREVKKSNSICEHANCFSKLVEKKLRQQSVRLEKNPL